MRTAIVYYSMHGNTKYVAEKIAKKMKMFGDVDLISLVPEEAYPDKGFKKFFWGGKSAVMGEMPILQPYKFDVKHYDCIVLGTPVWASTFTPPLRTFVHDNHGIEQKQLAVFTCYSGGGADKAIAKLKKFIGITKFWAELILIDPKDKVKEEDDEKIATFCKSLLTR